MQPRITVVTIGVDDLERALHFYRDGLGLATEGIIGCVLPRPSWMATSRRSGRTVPPPWWRREAAASLPQVGNGGICTRV